MAEYYVGTLSGTSADGIDVVLADFADEKPRLVAANTYPIPDAVRAEIRALSTPTDNEIERLGRLDVTLGRLIAAAVNELLAEAGVANSEVIAIGSHGQTLRHRPDADPPFTLQVGDPNTIAARTGITTVADFRRMDMACGGQGAPFAPVFHAAMFRQEGIDRAVVNLGGIANVTLLPGNTSKPISGFDTGPANGLLDEWCQRHTGIPYDDHGAWAAKGQIVHEALEKLLTHPYFVRPAPKSTGREVFNFAWLQASVDLNRTNPQDVQATLAELTAVTITNSIRSQFPGCSELFVCGGGAHNDHLRQRIIDNLTEVKLRDTGTLGIDPDWVEGLVFAWFARRRFLEQPLDLHAITGARVEAVAGALYHPTATPTDASELT